MVCKQENQNLKILYLDQHFALSEGMTIPRSFAISKYLVDRGHKVTVITGVNRKSGLSKYWKGKLLSDFNFEGIKVILVGIPYAHLMVFLRRVLSFISFMSLSSLKVLFIERPDLVFATSTPLTTGIPALIVCKLEKIPFVFEVRDLWPEFSVKMGILKNPLMIKLAEWLERSCYANAEKVFTISDGLRERLIELGLPPKKVKSFPIGVDLKAVESVPVDTSFRLENGLKDKFVAVYAGALGLANGVDVLIEAAKYLKGHPKIIILIIGEGKVKEALISKKRQYSLENILFCEAMPRKKLISIIMDLDVGLMITRNLIPSMSKCPNLPRKFFDYLAAGLPVVVNVEGDMSKLVQDNRIGLVCKEKDAKGLATNIIRLCYERELKEEMGKNATRIIANYDLDKIAGNFEKEFRSICFQAES